jgi:hypothetical protein
VETIIKTDMSQNLDNPIPITPEALIAAGFEEKKGLIIDSYRLIIKATYAKLEALDISRNSDRWGDWYVSFRQGNHVEQERWHENDLVFLRNNVRYMHQIEAIYTALTDQQLSI